MNKKLENSEEVWEYLKTDGGLNIKNYDCRIMKELRKNLNLPKYGSFGKQLAKRRISTEKFIIEFFNTVEPFSKMLTDLLCLFQKANAKYGDKNMSIKFNFNKKLNKISFDLSHFKEWEEKSKVVLKKYYSAEIKDHLFWDLEKVFDMDLDCDKYKKEHYDLDKWMEIYEKDMWPDFDIYPLTSGDDELDEKVKQAWEIWNCIVEKNRNYGKSPKKLKDLISDKDNKELRQLAMLESDRWTASFIQNLFYTINKINTLELSQKKVFIDNLKQNLECVLKKMNFKKYEKKEMIKDFEEFLKLPIWKRRYELYSAWIFSKIVDALGSENVKIFSENRTISFSFSGVKLATYNLIYPEIEIWTELRTKFDNPIGKGRKNGIQPDYSLAVAPVNKVESSALVVECKQYLRPSVKNFLEALQDYAKGRPKANVILVDYGEVNQRILDRVDPLVRGRTAIIGNMRPGCDKAINDFKKKVKSSLKKSYYIDKNVSLANKLNMAAKIKLTWGELPKDLDLILDINLENKRDRYMIGYMNKGSKLESPKAIYGNDERNGNATEDIKIFEWIKGEYTILVHNYSKERSIAGCGAKVLLKISNCEKEFCCPQGGHGVYWVVAKVCVNDRINVETENIIVEDYNNY